jgi:hypothetical protein
LDGGWSGRSFDSWFDDWFWFRCYRRRLGWRRCRRVNDPDGLLYMCGLGLFLDGLGDPGGNCRIGLDDFFLKPLGADFIKRTGRDLGGSNAHFLGLRENFFVLEAKFLCNVVYTNGHNFFQLPQTGMCASPSWLKSHKNKLL